MKRDVRDCLREYINDKGYKKTVLAAKAGMSKNALCQVLKKRQRLEANEYLRICDALEVSPTTIRNYESKLP